MIKDLTKEINGIKNATLQETGDIQKTLSEAIEKFQREMDNVMYKAKEEAKKKPPK